MQALGQVLVLVGLYRGARPFISLLNDADSKRMVNAFYIVSLALCAALIASIHLRVSRGLTLEGLSSTILSTVPILLDVALLTVTLKVVAFFMEEDSRKPLRYSL